MAAWWGGGVNGGSLERCVGMCEVEAEEEGGFGMVDLIPLEAEVRMDRVNLIQ